jgi:hypothetical protein
MPPALSYGTVRDFCDSMDHLRDLASCSGDLKDAQRPWMVKAILGGLPRGSRLLEIGAGHPYVASLLTRLVEGLGLSRRQSRLPAVTSKPISFPRRGTTAGGARFHTTSFQCGG